MRPEVLAPAGDEACFDAAIAAGADAVYLGLSAHNARARATNFSPTSLPALVERAHRRGVRVYVTLNTLVFDHELESVAELVAATASAGADAIIVQDLGLVRLARSIAPSLAVHASTQMTCTDAASVAFAVSMGVSRVVVARELSLDDLATLRKGTDAELEVFVHGALCVAYSGQCNTSEAIGGRSANRGACAQACRLPYELVVDGRVHDLGDRAYLLSMQDLEGSEQVPALAELGVASLKIEGRLKSRDYVAASTRLYRAAVDAHGGLVTEDRALLRHDAALTYTRGSGPGFFRGTDHQRTVEGRTVEHRGLPLGTVVGTVARGGKTWLELDLSLALARGDGLVVEGGYASRGEFGGRVWLVEARGDDVESATPGVTARVWLGPNVDAKEARTGARVFKSGSPEATRRIAERIGRAPYRRALALTLRGKLGAPFELEGRLESGVSARVVGDAEVVRAERHPLTREVVEDKLGRMGDSAFALGSLELDWPADATVPVSSLNRARRALVAELETPRAAHHVVSAAGTTAVLEALTWPTTVPPAGLYVLCRDLVQAKAALDAGADGVYLDFLDLVGLGRAVGALREGGAAFVGVAPPRIRKPGEERIDRYLDQLAPDAILVRSLGALHEARSPDAPRTLRIGDFSLNVANRITASVVLGSGLDGFTPSFDLDERELAALLRTEAGRYAEFVLHHPMPLFHTEHCVFAATLSEGRDFRTCGRPCERHVVSLRDRAGMEHPVEADVGCRNTVFHRHPQSAAASVATARDAGVRRFRIELVRENATETSRIVRSYSELLAGRIDAAKVFATLRDDRGAKVVRGSLRVL